VGVVDQAIQDGIGDVVMPVFNGKLAADEGGAVTVAVLDDFEKISPFGIVQRSQTEIVQDKHMSFGELLHESSVGAIGAGESDLIEELGRTEIQGAEAFPAGFLGQGTGDEGFSNTCRTQEQEILVISDPVTRGKAQDHRFLYTPGSSVVDILDTSLKLQFGVLEEPFEVFVFFPDLLAIHEKTQTFLEREGVEGGLLELFLEALGHADELHEIEFVEGLFIEHPMEIPFIGSIVFLANWHVRREAEGFDRASEAAGPIRS
jgi:hypothetical protein